MEGGKVKRAEIKSLEGLEIIVCQGNKLQNRRRRRRKKERKKERKTERKKEKEEKRNEE